jgi:ABC-type nickel/cobalt efflux system permease component RcnA
LKHKGSKAKVINKNMDEKSVIFKRRIRFSLIILVSQFLLIALAIGWGVNLILIAQHGGLYSVETNPLILYGEIVATVLIIIFALFVIYLEIVRMRTKRQRKSNSNNQIKNEKQPQSADNTDTIESVEDLLKST